MSAPGSAITPTNQSASRRGTFTSNSISTLVKSLGTNAWWTEEEARLYKEWGSSLQKYSDIAPNPYFDYFFTGQDVRIKIDALEDKEHLPVYSFGYQIQQQKQPLYGYASYVYDAMLRGTRIITGAFSLVVTDPHLLTSQIAKSAEIRSRTSQAASAYGLRNYDGDAENIDRYWRRNYDSGLDINDKHLFSIHPPFNLIIKYGLQETSLVSNKPDDRIREIKDNFNQNSNLWTNVNERLVEDNTPQRKQILLENIELTSKAVEYDPSGDPILETYTFLARDERFVEDGDMMHLPGKLPSVSNPNLNGNSSGGGALRVFYS